jgi:uncharacterized membrane protein YqaE (UPF0057 family)
VFGITFIVNQITSILFFSKSCFRFTTTKTYLSMKKILLLGGAIMLMLSSCTMQKCVYNKGFYVDWFDAPSIKKSESTEANEKTLLLTDAKLNQEVVATPAFIASLPEVEVSAVQSLEKIKNVEAKPIAVLSQSFKESAPVVASTLTKKELKAAVKDIKKNIVVNKTSGGDVPTWALYLLCFLIPPIAVGFATNWDINKVLINILWCLLCGLPGLIHALIIVSKS